jgi:hypothetical protein
LRQVTGIDDITLDSGHLHFRVRTDDGKGAFTMRWNDDKSQDFGKNGKVLVDLDENCYLIPDVGALPPRERDLLGRFVY